MNKLFPILLAMSLVGFAASAQTVTVTDQAGNKTTEKTEPATSSDASKLAKVDRRNCLTQTGSRITEARNLRAEKAGRPERECAPGYGRSYSKDDIDRTGQINIAEALRNLDPSVR